MTRAEVSLIVPNLNGGDILLDCLRSASAPNVETIIVDNASNDGSPEAALRAMPGVRVIRNSANKGFAAACNQGASAARGRYLLFLNSDARLAPGALPALLREAEDDRRAGLWQPLIVTHDGDVESAGALGTRTGFLWYPREPLHTSTYTVFAIECACLLVRREAFEQVGGFPDDYFAYFEMADLSWRARMAGWESRVVPTVHVDHLGGATTERTLAPAEVYHLAYRNRIRSILANTSSPMLVRTVAVHLPACLCLALGFLLAGRVRPALAVLRAVIWPLRNISAVRAQRGQAKRARRRPDAEVFAPEVVVRLTPTWALRQFRTNVRRW